ncbi:MAG: cupin domain-containing protein [Actinomycetota bacterium]|nr:cupin domain-containing protein [Actinomycetota bacterium]
MTTRTPSAAPDLAWGLDGLELTLGPVTTVTFLDEHWGRRPLVVERGEPGRFDAVLSAADAERLVCQTAIRTPAFRLVKDGAQLPLSTYTKDIPWRPGSFSGTALVDRVAEEHAAGATLVLQALHLHWHPAALYCRSLEASLGCPAQANAYWTPSSAQGFDVHHDTHDVFVLQVRGRKHWRLYEPVLELPLKDQRWSADLGPVGDPVAAVTLEGGDTLYLPRGWPHEAAAADADSLHITVGLHPPTRLDAMRAAVEACADDVEFRRTLDADGLLPDDLLDRLAQRLRPEAVAARAHRRFVDGRRPVLEDQLAQVRALDELGVCDLVERRPTVIADLEATAAGATLRFEGKEVRFPAQAVDAVLAAHAALEPFTPAELPGLDDPGRLVLVRRLVREGFLRRLRPPGGF